MKIKLLLLGFYLLPVVALAHIPELPVYERYEDTQIIADPTISRAFYAELTGFPHNYEFTLDTEKEISVELLNPDIKEATDNRSAIIVKYEKRGVSEVARLNYQDADWESFYEPFGGDSYRRGPAFKGTLPAGRYLLEVNTSENFGKYVLVVGQLENFSEVGFLETLKRIYQVKQFYGKPPIATLQSPFYLVPVSILLMTGVIVYRRKHA